MKRKGRMLLTADLREYDINEIASVSGLSVQQVFDDCRFYRAKDENGNWVQISKAEAQDLLDKGDFTISLIDDFYEV